MPPTILEYPEELQKGEALLLKGDANYPRIEVTLWLQKEKEDAASYRVQSDSVNAFTFIIKKGLEPGIYKAWVEVKDERGARSDLSQKIAIRVADASFFKAWSWTANMHVIAVFLTMFVILLLFIIGYGWYRFTLFKSRLRKEIQEAEQAVHKSIDVLKEDLIEQIRTLEHAKSKRKLTQEEEKIIRQIRKNLDDVEKFVQKEIQDIKREVE